MEEKRLVLQSSIGWLLTVRKKEVKSLLNPFNQQRKFADVLNSKIPPQRYLFKGNIFPVGELTLIAGHNGSGKTTLATQIIMQGALNRCFMKDNKGKEYFAPEGKLKIAVLSFEDDLETYALKMQNILNNYPDISTNTRINNTESKRIISEQVDIFSMSELSGQETLLTNSERSSQKIIITDAYKNFVGKMNENKYDLVLIDPWHYATTAQENDNNEQAQHAKHITSIAREFSCSIVGFAHTTDGTPDRVRGATSVMDRARQGWSIATLQRILKNKGSNKHIPSPERSDIPKHMRPSDVLWLKQSKNSRAKLQDQYDLFYNESGCIVPFRIEKDQMESQEQQIISFIKSRENSTSTLAIIMEGMQIAKSTLQRKIDLLVDTDQLFNVGKKGQSKLYSTCQNIETENQ